MATPNNLTPTNCSWWPISALESDAAKPAEAPDAPEAASPAHWPKESLVLYHWTQSFSSQKVQPEKAGEPDRLVARTRGEEILVGLRGLMSWRETAGWNLGFRGRRTGAAGLLSWGGEGGTGPALGPTSIVPSSRNTHPLSFPKDSVCWRAERRQRKARGREWAPLGRRPVGGGGCCGEGGGALPGVQPPAPVVLSQALPLRCCPRYYRPPQVTAPLRLRLVGGLPLTGTWRVCL